jgi:hypothetical protein
VLVVLKAVLRLVVLNILVILLVRKGSPLFIVVFVIVLEVIFLFLLTSIEVLKSVTLRKERKLQMF